MKKFLIVLIILIGFSCQAQKSVNALGLGIGMDFINKSPIMNVNLIFQDFYTSYSLSTDNTVKNYDIGYIIRGKHLFIIPTLGVTYVNSTNSKRYYHQTVNDNNITITEISVDVSNNSISKSSIPLPIVTSGTQPIDVIDQIEYNNVTYVNVGVFTGYKLNDGLMLFIKATNNSIGFGIACAIN